MPIITAGYNGTIITTPDNPHGTLEDMEAAYRERMKTYERKPLDEISSLKDQLTAAQTTIATDEAALSANSANDASARTALQAAQSELEDTKQQLQTTKQTLEDTQAQLEATKQDVQVVQEAQQQQAPVEKTEQAS